MEEQCASINRIGVDSTNTTSNIIEDDEHKKLDIVIISAEASSDGSSSSSDERSESILGIGSDSSSYKKQRMEKVPEILRRNQDNNNRYYDPCVVSIGPYHHGKPELEQMEKLKPKIMKEFLRSTWKSVKYVYDKVAEVANDATSCYAEGSTDAYNDQELAKMMFLDGCFVSYIIVCTVQQEFHRLQLLCLDSLSQYILGPQIFLLENQLPSQVLYLLMRLKVEEDKVIQVFSTFINFFSSGSLERLIELEAIIGSHEHHHVHLLELYRRSILPKWNDRPLHNYITDKGKNKLKSSRHPRYLLYSFRSVTELKAKGIRFKPADHHFALRDIEFKSYYFYGQLTIPSRVVSPLTKGWYLNLIAYEMCPNSPNDLGFTSYVNFMSSLIDNPEDVKELRSKHILLNNLGSDEEVVKLFREISICPFSNYGIYEDVRERIQQHYDSKMKTWIAEVIHNYFTSPWAFIALIAATFVIVLTFLQTYFTLFPRD